MGLARRVTVVLCAIAALAADAQGQAPRRTLLRGLFEVDCAAADEAIGQRSLDVLEQALTEFEPRLPPGEGRIRVTVCRNLPEFKELAGAYGATSVGGIAKSEQGLIVVKAPYLLPERQDYRGMLRHELIHVLLARNTNAANTPRWFDEGVAMVISKELRWESSLRIARMYARRRLIHYPDLNIAFAPRGDEGTFDDAYAQALSMTRYLYDRAGEEKFWEIVHALKTITFEDALRKYADLTPAGLYDAWHASLWKVALIASLVSGFSAFQLMALLVIVAYLRKRRRGQKLLRQWEEEEAEPDVFHWEDVVDGPYPWEEEKDEDAEK